MSTPFRILIIGLLALQPAAAKVGPPADQASTPAPQSCPVPLRQGCEAQQASCQMACPPLWSNNPAAPAFTTTNRAGCTRQCFNRYLSCLRV